MTPINQPAQHLGSLQALRGFAALAVCLAHLHAVEAKFGGTAILGNWATIGFAGVDLFFVISGFVMVWVTQQAQGQVPEIPRFWLGRAFRIYPLWWLVLSAVVVVWLVKPEWVYSGGATNPDLLRSYLLLPASQLPLHAVGWTLVHEVWFYFVFGLLLALPPKALPFLLLFWATAVGAASLIFPSPSSSMIALIRHPLSLEFIIGAFVGILACKDQFFRPKLMLQAGVFWLILSCASIVSAPTGAFEVEWQRVLLFGGPFALIIWGWVGLEKIGHRAPYWSQALGDWSYALYLVHVLVFVAIGRLTAPLSMPGFIDNIVLIVVALASAIIAAYVLHMLVERPVQRFARRMLRKGAD